MTESQRDLENLIREFVGKLTTSVTDWLLELLYAGEAGIALEELCAQIGEADLAVDSRQLEIIRRLGEYWRCDPKWLSGLRTAQDSQTGRRQPNGSGVLDGEE